MNLSIIIQAHNEENSIEEVIKAIEQNVSVEHEIVVVNDHSSDKTTDIVERLAAQYRNNLSLVSNHNEPGFACFKVRIYAGKIRYSSSGNGGSMR